MKLLLRHDESGQTFQCAYLFEKPVEQKKRLTVTSYLYLMCTEFGINFHY